MAQLPASEKSGWGFVLAFEGCGFEAAMLDEAAVLVHGHSARDPGLESCYLLSVSRFLVLLTHPIR
jgi:hypothetical protein